MTLNPKTRNLFVRTASGIVYVALMVAAVFTPWVAVPLMLFFAFVGLYEFYKLCNDPSLRTHLGFWIVADGCLIECLLNMEILNMDGVSSIPWTFMACIAGFCIFLPELIGKNEQAMSHVGLGFLSQIWIVIPLCVLFFLWIPQQPALVLAFLILIWMSDTAAYVFGSLFGKHKLAPNISPGKTWEGFLCSCVFTVGLAIGLSYIPFFEQAGMPLWGWIVFALIIQVFGLMGDLTESLFKRKAGVKDSGNIIPGHGGVLDRVDSILFATIPAYLFALSF
jgi:phosphatidate cytidylyltransferase